MADKRKIRGEVVVTEETKELLKKVRSVSSYQELMRSNIGIPTTQFLEILMAGGVKLNASDVHIEPEEEQVQIRVRIDGVLQDVLTLTPSEYDQLLTRLKLTSELKLNISDRPQDGRFSVIFNRDQEDELEAEIRVSSLPAEHGETVVMRILNPNSLKDLPELGLRPDLLEIVREQIKKPNGMIVSTGPTGSGKTTSLYAFCRELSGPKIKIVTIEDPIEYHLDGLSQTQVNPKKGYDFASGLRSIVRQDPDVILVGEMRDKETVGIALQAALTGHLVLTTLHTNDATGVVTRLISLEGKTANIGPALSMVLGQRLVRRVCQDCKILREPNKKEKDLLKEVLGSVPSDAKVTEANGCPRCDDTGYKGRVGIFEIFVVDDELEDLIVQEPSSAALERKAKEKGMTSMKYDGFLKVLEGQTTMEEIIRATG